MKTKSTFSILCRLLSLSKCFLLSAFCFLLPTSNIFAQPITLDPEDCDPISTFPWTEGFEDNGLELPPCWEQQILNSYTWQWTIVPDSIGTPPNAHGGNYKARIYLSFNGLPVYRTRLVTPVFDLSQLNTPVLNFWFTNKTPPNNPNLNIYYKNSSEGGWVLLKKITESITNWQEEFLLLPNKSTYYQIAFQAMFTGGIFEIQLDDISIFETGVPALTYRVYICTNSGVSATGAMVTLTNNDGNPEHIYTETSDENGVTFHNIFLGSYHLKITLPEHNDYIANNLIISGSGLEHSAQLIETIETLVAPTNLSVEIDDENRSALFSWDLSRPCQGFTVYLDDEQIATGVQNTEYLFTDLVSSNYKAGVKAEYLSGSSEMVHTNFSVLSIDEKHTMKHFLLSPNPVQDLLYVKRYDATPVKVNIYNSMGALIHSFETSETEFEVNILSYSAGVYFIRLSGNNVSITKSFVKQ